MRPFRKNYQQVIFSFPFTIIPPHCIIQCLLSVMTEWIFHDRGGGQHSCLSSIPFGICHHWCCNIRGQWPQCYGRWCWQSNFQRPKHSQRPTLSASIRDSGVDFSTLCLFLPQHKCLLYPSSLPMMSIGPFVGSFSTFLPKEFFPSSCMVQLSLAGSLIMINLYIDLISRCYVY